MKASLVLSIVFFCAMTSACAQVYIGPVAGGQISWTKFDEKDFYNTYGIKPVWGYHTGVNISMKVRKRFFLHSSVLYSTKGRSVQGREDPLLRNTVRYNFIEAPIMYAVDFRGRVGGGREFKYFLGAGPNISYWLGGKGTIYNSDLAENGEFSSEDLSYRIVFGKNDDEVEKNEMNVAKPNRVQLGLNVGTGIVFEPRPNRRILLMIRYELGHSFLSRSNGKFAPTYYEDVLQSRNKGFRVSVSYLVDLRLADRKKGKSTSRIGKGN